MHSNHRSLYAWYVLAILVLVYAFNFMDRYVLVILMEPIKQDLHLSDSQLGLLTGFVFSVVYSAAGIPLAFIADRHGRKQLLMWSLAIWSGLTILSGFAKGFGHLVMTRMGVAVSESGSSPAAHSLIADYFPAEKRGTAYAVYGLGISIGIGGGLSLGGWASEHYGWQAAFFIVGTPGLLLALLIGLTIREPRRTAHTEAQAVPAPVSAENAADIQGSITDNVEPAQSLTIGQAIKTVLDRKWFWFTAGALGLLSFAGSAFEMWTPTFLMRIHGYSPAETGALSGLTEGLSGIIGTLAGGLLADKFGAKNKCWYLWIPAIVGVTMLPFMLGFLHAAKDSLLPFYIGSIISTSSYMAPIVAIVQSSMPAEVRAQASALLLLVLNMVGPGAGVFCAGVLADMFANQYGSQSLIYALSCTSFVGLLGVGSALIAAKLIKRDTLFN